MKSRKPDEKRLEAFHLAYGFVCFLTGAKGRNWFGLFAGVRKRSCCAQRATVLSALVHGLLLSIVVFAVSFAVKKKARFLFEALR